MNNLLKAEQAMQFVICVAAFHYQPIHIAWWLWPIVFLAPDLSMIGYVANTRVGAVCYNLAHHKAIAGAFIAWGMLGYLEVPLFIGILLWAHSSFDRMLGYGLKFTDSFQHTHLGMIGKKVQ